MWTLQIKSSAKKDLDKIERQIQKRILQYLRSKVLAHPRKCGKALIGNLFGYWRYRNKIYDK